MQLELGRDLLFKSALDEIRPGGFSPSQVYAYTYYRIPKYWTVRPNPYLQTSYAMTSAGFASETRIDRRDPQARAIGLQANNRLAEVITGMLISQRDLDPLVIAPGDIGYFAGWKTFDYNLFSLSLIVGLDPDDQRYLGEKLRAAYDNPAFNDDGLGNDARRQLFGALARDLALFIYRKNIPHHPVAGLVRLFGYQSSLGCYAEQKLADLLAIPTHTVSIDTTHPDMAPLQTSVMELQRTGEIYVHTPPRGTIYQRGSNSGKAIRLI